MLKMRSNIEKTIHILDNVYKGEVWMVRKHGMARHRHESAVRLEASAANRILV